jgi:carboxylesterase
MQTSPAALPAIGCLLLHGFTSSLATVDGLIPHLKAAGVPYALPTLRGHGTRPEDLRGVTWPDWCDDAARALDELLTRCERVVVMGLSMGGLVALHLGVQHPERLAGIVSVAGALRLIIPARFLLPILGRFGSLTAVDARKAFADQSRAAGTTNYPSAPLSAIYSLVQFGTVVEQELPRLRVPLLVLYTPQDRVVEPASATIIYERAGTPPTEKALRAFPESGHEMLQDCQRDAVCTAIMAFIAERATHAAAMQP